jgi:hypothetical protein
MGDHEIDKFLALSATSIVLLFPGGHLEKHLKNEVKLALASLSVPIRVNSRLDLKSGSPFLLDQITFTFRFYGEKFKFFEFIAGL